MPLIRPFRALRYGQNHLASLSELVWPCRAEAPSEPEQVGEVHEHNVRRLVRGDYGDLAPSDAPRFTHAAKLLQRWKADGVVVRDPRPSLYPIEERWDGGKRRGVVALVRLGAPDGGDVLPHEATAGHSEENLLTQLKTVQAQLSLVMAMVPDESRALRSFLEEDRGDPDFWVEDGAGIKTGVWRESNPEAQLELIEALRSETAVLADGHHRYRAALAQQQEAMELSPGSSRETPLDYVMMLLVPVEQGGLVCAATHRVCPRLNPEARAVLESSLPLFEIEAIEDGAALQEFLNREEEGYRFGQVLDGKITGLRLRSDATVNLPGPLSTVDSAVLEELLLRDLRAATELDWDDPSTTGSSGSPFSHNHQSAEDILAKALAGEIEFALFSRPPTSKQVFDVASAGQLLPPKSTNFRPKPSKGLLMASLKSF